VVALARSELLELDAQDLYRLFESKPQLRTRIMEEAERRRANTPADDLDERGMDEGRPG
jgi:CRP-like cAMP-binding protein